MWDSLRQEIFIYLLDREYKLEARTWLVRREGVRSHCDYAGGLLGHERGKLYKGVSWKR